jgi:hypothetical protein
MGPENPTCAVCDRRIRLSDAFEERRTFDEDGGKRSVRIHRACGKDGVERWNRENRPRRDPLVAARREGWSWHVRPPDRR